MVDVFQVVLANLLIILRLPTPLDRLLEDTHLEALKEGFYVDFRKDLHVFFESLRDNIESRPNYLLYFFMISRQQLQLSTYQKICTLLYGSSEFRKILMLSKFSGRKVVFPMSKEHLRKTKILKKNLIIAPSELAWKLTLLAFFCRAILRLIVVLCRKIAGSFIETGVVPLSKGISILDPSNFFVPDQQARRIFVDWVESVDSEKQGSSETRQINYDDNQGGGLKSELRKLNFMEMLRFSIMFHLVINFKDLLTARLFSRENTTDMGTLLLVPNTFYVVQPIWIEQFKNCGHRVIFFHYAIGSEPLHKNNTYPIDPFWPLATWKQCWVIDEVQARDMRQSLDRNDPKITVTGFPRNSLSLSDLKKRKTKNIAVFDSYIRPPSSYLYGSLDEYGWSEPSVEFVFIEWIMQVADEFDLEVWHKKKRLVTERSSEKFAHYIEGLDKRYPDRYSLIDEDKDASAIIDQSNIIIVKPISSVGLLAKQRGAKVAYLDPTAGISKIDPSLRGIPLCQSILELKLFVCENLFL